MDSGPYHSRNLIINHIGLSQLDNRRQTPLVKGGK